MKVLHVVEDAYRCTLCEQDNPAIAMILSIKNLASVKPEHLGVLFRGNGVNYAVMGQDSSQITVAGYGQSFPPRVQDDVYSLLQAKVPVFAIRDDIDSRGIDVEDMHAVELIGRDSVAELFSKYDQIWHW